jgi:signal transduction histidine kinase
LRRHRSRFLFWRIFIHGLLLIVVVTAISGAAFHFLADEPIWRGVHQRVGQLVERSLEGDGVSEQELSMRLDEVAYVMDGAVAVYGNDGELLAAAGEPIPPPFDGDPRDLDEHDWYHAEGKRVVAVPLPSGERYAVFEPPHKGGPENLVIGLTILFVVVALMSIPLARAIARPLERITGTARRLGDGDLSARTGITRRDEVGLLARTLDEMATRLERKLRAEKELLAGASHEIRTPLARIKVALELCAEEGVTVEQLKSNLQGIAGDAAELERLVEDALIVARLDLADGDGDLPLRRGPIPIGELLDETRDRFGVAHPTRELVARADGPDVAIEVDASLVRRMLDNLIDNAAKYSDSDQPIEVIARVEGDRAVLEVRDLGIGIPDDELELVFEPFHRTDRSRSRGTGGTGLGLTLCKRIAQAHGGAISALPRDGGGVIVRAELPIGRPVAGE